MCVASPYLMNTAVAVSLPPWVVVVVLVFFKHFVTNPFHHVAAAYPCQDGLQMKSLAADLVFVQFWRSKTPPTTCSSQRFG